MSELQGPRIPGEERSGRRRPLGWIIGGLITLLLLALLIPFACQALGGDSDPQGGQSGGSGVQEQTSGARGNDREQGAANEGETTSDGAEGTSDGAGEVTDSGTAGEQAGSGSESGVAAQLASIGEVRSADGRTVTIPRATIAGTDGWIAIHQDAGGEPKVAESVGHVPLQEGESTNIQVKLERPITSSQRLYAMIHTDDPPNGRYTFPEGDPPTKSAGKVAVEPFQYLVSGGQARGGTSGEQVQAGDVETLPGTGGLSPAVLLAGGAGLLLLGTAGLYVSLRSHSLTGG